MSRLPQERLDVGVVIERVRVVVDHQPPRAGAAATELPRSPSPHPGDHRILMRELRIEADARLDREEARLLGEEVSAELRPRLSALQRRRLDAIVSGRSRGGVVRIGALCVKLRGAEARRRSAASIAGELTWAIEQRVLPCR